MLCRIPDLASDPRSRRAASALASRHDSIAPCPLRPAPLPLYRPRAGLPAQAGDRLCGAHAAQRALRPGHSAGHRPLDHPGHGHARGRDRAGQRRHHRSFRGERRRVLERLSAGAAADIRRASAAALRQPGPAAGGHALPLDLLRPAGALPGPRLRRRSAAGGRAERHAPHAVLPAGPRCDAGDHSPDRAGVRGSARHPRRPFLGPPVPAGRHPQPRRLRPPGSALRPSRARSGSGRHHEAPCAGGLPLGGADERARSRHHGPARRGGLGGGRRRAGDPGAADRPHGAGDGPRTGRQGRLPRRARP